jgi:antitoxin PrlF
MGTIAKSRITAQGQISVPADVRKRLGVGPGSVLEWNEEGNNVVVKRSGKYTFADMRNELFKDRKPEHHTLEELKEGVRKYIRKKHARS